MNLFPLCSSMNDNYFLHLQELLWDDFFSDKKYIIDDNRILPLIIHHELVTYLDVRFDSLKLLICESQNLQKWYIYPENGSNFQKKYEQLSLAWYELDIMVISKKQFNKLSQKKITYKWIEMSLEFEHDFWIFSQKVFSDLQAEKNILHHISHDKANIYENIVYFRNMYLRYIEVYRLFSQKEFMYKHEFLFYFLRYYILKFKWKLKVYESLFSEWYTNMWEYLEWKISSSQKWREVWFLKHIHMDSNITWSIHKVYNKQSASNMKRWDIMLAYNTNPEFLKAFYSAKAVCVETFSELSHAAVTCRELWIPLVLWASWIMDLGDWQNITIDISQKKIITQ